ncbi:unnamed protein product, partial [Brassica oleracea]
LPSILSVSARQGVGLLFESRCSASLKETRVLISHPSSIVGSLGLQWRAVLSLYCRFEQASQNVWASGSGCGSHHFPSSCSSHFVLKPSSCGVKPDGALVCLMQVEVSVSSTGGGWRIWFPRLVIAKLHVIGVNQLE